MQKKTIFIVHTIYQVFIALKLIAEEKHQNISKNNIIIDCTGKNLNIKKIASTLSFEVYKFNLSGYYTRQLILARSDVHHIIAKVGSAEILYVFNDVLPFVSEFARCVRKSKGFVIFVQEGLSVYRRIPLFSLENLKGIIKSNVSIIFGLRCSIKFGHSPYLSKLMLSNPQLFAKNHPNHSLPVELFNNSLTPLLAICESNEINALNETARIIKYPAFIYLGQPLSELRFISDITEHTVLNNIRSICMRLGINFYIKAHPFEIKSKYSSDEVLLSDLPVELLINVLDKRKLILASAFSSVNFNFFNHELKSNLYLYKLFGIDPAISNLPIRAVENYGELESLLVASQMIV